MTIQYDGWEWKVRPSTKEEHEALKYLMDALHEKWGKPSFFTTRGDYNSGGFSDGNEFERSEH